jgi:hypothetical protein
VQIDGQKEEKRELSPFSLPAPPILPRSLYPSLSLSLSLVPLSSSLSRLLRGWCRPYECECVRYRRVKEEETSSSERTAQLSSHIYALRDARLLTQCLTGRQALSISPLSLPRAGSLAPVHLISSSGAPVSQPRRRSPGRPRRPRGPRRPRRLRRRPLALVPEPCSRAHQHAPRFAKARTLSRAYIERRSPG